MNKRVLFLFPFLLLFQHIAAAKSKPVAFVANKRQWQDVIKYIANVQGGAAFFLKAGFTFNYCNVDDVNKMMELQR